MRKDYDFDDELDDLEEQETEMPALSPEKAKILVTIIPFVLIILILAITLLVSSSKNKKLQQDNEELQESIKEYADSNLPENIEAGNMTAATSEPEKIESESEPVITSAPSASPAAVSTPTPYKEIMESGSVNYDKISFDKDEQLKEMMTYWADNNQKALDDLANLDRFKAMSWKLRGTKDFYYYGDVDGNGQPNGTGIAVYADNQYYYGGWANGTRSGEGTWIHYHIHTTPSTTDLYTYHQYTGSWKNDLPDGEGSEHYDCNTELFVENVGYNTNLIGSYSEGLIDGEFYITNIYSDGNVKEWYAQANHGSWVYQNENKDAEGRRPVQVEDRNPDNYIWMSPAENKNIGVQCLISVNKN